MANKLAEHLAKIAKDEDKQFMEGIKKLVSTVHLIVQKLSCNRISIKFDKDTKKIQFSISIIYIYIYISCK